MISSNLIKSIDELMIEIANGYFMKEDLKTNPRNQKSKNLTLILQTNSRLNKDEFPKMKNHEIHENKNEIILNYILN